MRPLILTLIYFMMTINVFYGQSGNIPNRIKERIKDKVDSYVIARKAYTNFSYKINRQDFLYYSDESDGFKKPGWVQLNLSYPLIWNEVPLSGYEIEKIDMEFTADTSWVLLNFRYLKNATNDSLYIYENSLTADRDIYKYSTMIAIHESGRMIIPSSYWGYGNATDPIAQYYKLNPNIPDSYKPFIKAKYYCRGVREVEYQEKNNDTLVYIGTGMLDTAVVHYTIKIDINYPDKMMTGGRGPLTYEYMYQRAREIRFRNVENKINYVETALSKNLFFYKLTNNKTFLKAKEKDNVSLLWNSQDEELEKMVNEHNAFRDFNGALFFVRLPLRSNEWFEHWSKNWPDFYHPVERYYGGFYDNITSSRINDIELYRFVKYNEKNDDNYRQSIIDKNPIYDTIYSIYNTYDLLYIVDCYNLIHGQSYSLSQFVKKVHPEWLNPAYPAPLPPIFREEIINKGFLTPDYQPYWPEFWPTHGQPTDKNVDFYLVAYHRKNNKIFFVSGKGIYLDAVSYEYDPPYEGWNTIEGWKKRNLQDWDSPRLLTYIKDRLYCYQVKNVKEEHIVEKTEDHITMVLEGYEYGEDIQMRVTLHYDNPEILDIEKL